MTCELDMDQLRKKLRPLSFKADIGRYSEKFIGRHWVWQEISLWLGNVDASRALWLFGKPGVGKTALMCYLYNAYKERIAAFHMCRYSYADRCDPRKWVLSLAYQLAEKLPEYRRRLVLTDLDSLSGTAPDLLDTLVIQPIADINLQIKVPFVVIIDGLDEAAIDKKNAMAEIIIEAFEYFPDWLRLIVSSRPEPDLRQRLSQLRPYELDTERGENRKDIEDYLLSELRKFAANDNELNRAVTAILPRSEGLFLYAEWVCREVLNNRLSLMRPEEFPQGLGGIYLKFFERQFSDIEKYKKEFRPVLEVLVAAQEPVSLVMLQELFNWDNYDQNGFENTLGSLINVHDDRVSFFHASLADWLASFRKSGVYSVSASSGHSLLAKYGWMKYSINIDQMPRYMLRHLAIHLQMANWSEKLVEILCDLEYVERKYANNLQSDLLADYNRALRDERLSNYHSEFRDFIVFARRQGHILHKKPYLTLQQASNEPEGAAPARKAKICWDKDKRNRTLLHWVNRPEETDQCVMVLKGHTDYVTSCVYIDEQGWIVSGSDDRTLRVWDVESGQTVRVLEGHTRSVTSCAYIRERGWIISGSDDKTLRVWDVESGQLMRVLQGHTDRVTSCAYINERDWIVSGSADRTLRVWDAESGQLVRVLAGHSDIVTSCIYIDERDWIVSGSADTTLRVWNAQSGQLERVLKGTMHTITCCAYLSGLDWIVSGASKILRVWDLEEGQPVSGSMGGHTGGVTCCRYISGQDWIVSGSDDKTLRVWNAESGQLMGIIKGHIGAITSCTYICERGWIVSGSKDITLRVWEVANRQLVRSLEGYMNQVTYCEYVSGRDWVFSNDGYLHVWDATSGELVWVDYVRNVTCFSYINRRESIVLGFNDGSLRVRSVEANRLEYTLEYTLVGDLNGHTDRVTSCVYIDERDWIISGAADTTLRVWDVESGQTVRVLEGHTRSVTSCAYIRERGWIISGSDDKTLRVWDAESGQLMWVLQGHTDRVTSCAYINERGWIVSGSADRTLRVWDAESGQLVRVLAGHSDIVTSCIYIDERDWIVSGSADGTLQVWDVESGQPVAEFCADEQFFAVAGKQDGSRLFAGGALGKIYFLEVVSMIDKPKQAEKIEIFFSYSHKDQDLRDKLEKQLSVLKRQRVIECWHDAKITPGEKWDQKIIDSLSRAQIILLLISEDFMASDYIWESEVKIALERHERGDAKVIPIILRPVDWHDAPFGNLQFGDIQALPKDGRPATMWPNIDEAFYDIAQGIKKIIKK